MSIKQKDSVMAQNIRKLRLAHGMTQAELAEKLFVGQSAVARWENNDTLPCRKYWPGLARALGCTVEELQKQEAV